MHTVTATVAAVHAGAPVLPLVDAALQRCAGDTNNAVVRLLAERARAAAATVQARLTAGERPALAGVPLLVKDNLLVQGAPATAASRILEGFVAPYTATAVARLEAAGAVVVGHANMDEFAMGSSNERSVYGPVRNPRDPTRVPGGSSGGSAAAVAAGLVPVALGSDTGGSIRQPASLCGVVGYKPTYGAISRYGLIAYGSSLDQIGPLTTTVADAALVAHVMAGEDPADGTCARRAAIMPATLPGDPRAALRGARIGWVPAHVDGLQSAVRRTLDATKAALAEAGATLVEVALPREANAIPVYYVIATGEAASNLARFDGVRYGRRCADPADLHDLYARSRVEGFGPEVQRRIMLGTYVLSTGYYDAYYLQAQRVRRLLCDDFNAAFARCDAILGPVSPTTAWRLGEKTADPLQMYLADLFTLSANLAGLPGISVPCGSDEAGLPIGMQLQGAQWDDARLLSLAAGLEACVRSP